MAKNKTKKNNDIKVCIERNRAIRAGFTVNSVSQSAAESEMRRITNESFQRSVIEALYLIPEIAVCVDFWMAGIKTSSLNCQFKDKNFVAAYDYYMNEYEQMPGKTLRDLFNTGAWDHLFHGTEVVYVSNQATEIEGFKFPKKIIPVKFLQSGLKEVSRSLDGIMYEAKPFDKVITNNELIVSKRMAGPFDRIGISLLSRALSPVKTKGLDSELDSALSKVGIMSSFVLLKYGTEENPREDDELQELYAEIQQNMQMGIGIGVVPHDVSAEKVMGGTSSANAFNRDKIFETHFKSIDLAFGGVLTIISPKANLGSAAKNVIMGLHSLVDSERQDRKNNIINSITRRVVKLNPSILKTFSETPKVNLSSIEFSKNVTQENRIIEFDRGLISYETYMGDSYKSEKERLIAENEDGGDREIIIPRSLPGDNTNVEERNTEDE